MSHDNEKRLVRRYVKAYDSLIGIIGAFAAVS